jgi:hypothetical protein
MTKKKKDGHNKYYYDTDRNYPYNYSTPGDVKMSCPDGFEFGKPYSLQDLAEKSFKEHKEESDFGIQLDKIAAEITNLLKSKNAAYGNTALNPANIFSKLGPIEAIKARLDDKLSRISIMGLNDDTEDTAKDLIGYLFLLLMAIENKDNNPEQQKLF